MSEELIHHWEQYEPIISGVLMTGHIDWRNMYFDDYRQELRLLILKRLLAGEQLAPTNNSQLFRWLLWRLRDIQRSNQKYEERHDFVLTTPEVIQNEDAFEQVDLLVTIERLLNKQPRTQIVQQLLYDLLKYPDDLVTKRCIRLGIKRMTYYRQLKLVQQMIDKNHIA